MELSQVIANAKSFSDLHQITSEAKEGITFWGYRYIYLSTGNYKDVVHINTLALRVIEICASSCRTKVRISIEDCQIGNEVVRQIDRIFSMNDNSFKKRNILTKIICAIRDLFFEIKNRHKYPSGFVVEWQEYCTSDMSIYASDNSYLLEWNELHGQPYRLKPYGT